MSVISVMVTVIISVMGHPGSIASIISSITVSVMTPAPRSVAVAPSPGTISVSPGIVVASPSITVTAPAVCIVEPGGTEAETAPCPAMVVNIDIYIGGVVAPSRITGIIVAIIVIIRQLALRNTVGFHGGRTAIGVDIGKDLAFQGLLVLVGLLSEIVGIGPVVRVLFLRSLLLRSFRSDLVVTGVYAVVVVV